MRVEKYEVKKIVRRAMRETPAIDMRAHTAGADNFDAPPLTDAYRGMYYALKRCGVDASDPASVRDYFERTTKDDRAAFALREANVSLATHVDLDDMINDYPDGDIPAAMLLMRDELIGRLKREGAQYALVSLPSAGFQKDDLPHRMLIECVLPALKSAECPLMIASGNGIDFDRYRAMISIDALAYECPGNRFFLAHALKDGQDALVQLSIKHKNVILCGCPGEIGTPSVMKGVLTRRFERLGTGHIPAFSGAGSPLELIYFWDTARKILAEILTERYEALVKLGVQIDEDEIRGDVATLMRLNYLKYARKG